MPDEPQKPITVADLVARLLQLPQELPVAYQCCSEQMLLDLDDLIVTELQLPRPDGWVHDARPDKQKTPYLVFPGN